MPAFHAEPGLPYWIEILSSNPTLTAPFYQELMGWQWSPDVTSPAKDSTLAEEDPTSAEESLTSAEGYYIARKNGLPVASMVSLPEESGFPDSWITYFMTSDIDASMAKITAAGIPVLIEPTQAELGTMAVAVDPAGALFGLIEPDGPAFIAAGEPGCPVWYENMVAQDFNTTLDFYQNLLFWDIKQTGIATGAGYSLAMWEGAPFAGLYAATTPEANSFWQPFLGVQDIDAAAARISDLGGEVIEGPVDSELGRVCQILDATGAPIMLCEVEEPPAEEPRESDDLLDLADQLK